MYLVNQVKSSFTYSCSPRKPGLQGSLCIIYDLSFGLPPFGRVPSFRLQIEVHAFFTGRYRTLKSEICILKSKISGRSAPS